MFQSKPKPRQIVAAVVCVLTLMLVLSPVTLALAANDTAYATTGVNVRSGPGTKYKIVGGLNAGDTVRYLGKSGSWAKVLYNGSTAYVYAKYLKEYKGTTPPTNTTAYANATTYVYSGPGTTFPTAGVMYYGQAATILGTVGSWSYVKLNVTDVTGYVPTSYLSGTSQTGPAPTATAFANATTSVYSGPGASYQVIGTVNSGEAVTVLGTTGSWSHVTLNQTGLTGYVPTSYLSSTGSNAYLVYANSNTVIYSGPGASYTAVGTLYFGQSAYALGTSGGWTQILLTNGTKGYVPTSSLTASDPSTNIWSGSSGLSNTFGSGSGTTTPPPPATPNYPPVTTGADYTFGATGGYNRTVLRTTNVYAEPYTSSSAMYTLPQGAVVNVQAVLPGGWCKITWANSTFVYVPDSAFTYGSGIGGSAPVYPPNPTISTPFVTTAKIATSVFSGPDSAYTNLGTVAAGAAVYCTGISYGSWYQISIAGGGVGYIHANCLNI